MRKIFILIGVVTLSMSSCTKFLDVNQNENYPEQVEDYLIIPSAQASVSNVYSAYYGVLGGFWAQHWAQNNTSSQYKSYETYAMSGSDGVVDNSYRELYSGGLNDNEILLRKAMSEENWGLYLMSTTLKAYTFQMLVDLYDNVPYSEAFNAADGAFSPAIDKGEDIYAALYTSLDDALAKDMSSFNSARYSQHDLLGGANLNKWSEFARSIQLRLLVRQSGKNNVTAELTTLLANGGFLSSDVQLTNFENVDSKANPLFESDQVQLNTKNNIRTNAVLLYYLSKNVDPRKQALSNEIDDDYKGMITGSFDVIYNKKLPVAPDNFEGPLHIASPVLTWDMPVVLMSVAEVEFLQAEACLITGTGDAKAHYEAGVAASFKKLGVDVGTLLDAGNAYSYDDATNKLELIIMQKWVDAAWGQRGIEAFIEMNRTGYPAFSTVSSSISMGYDLDVNYSGNSTGYVSGTLVYSKLGSTGGNFPVRLPYADAEMNYNANSTEYKSLPDATVMQTRVWWNQ